MGFDGFNRFWAALGLAYHRYQASLRQHHLGEFIHSGGGGRAGRANHFAHHRINRADVIDRPALEINRQFLAALQHILNSLMRRIARCIDSAGK